MSNNSLGYNLLVIHEELANVIIKIEHLERVEENKHNKKKYSRMINKLIDFLNDEIY